MKKEDIIRIGFYIGKFYSGGVEQCAMNYYRNIDKSKIQFDFICDSDSTNIPYDEIEVLGGRCIIVPPYQNIFKFQKVFEKICRENKYKIVHSNVNSLSILPLKAAKKAGVPIRIAHSHSTSNKKEWKKTLIKESLKPFSKKYSTNYFACTEFAGRWLFGDKTYNEGNVTLINNAIELNSFDYNEEVRKEKRNEFNINDNTLVVGHVGRFVVQKNHSFLIDIFNEIHKKNQNSVLILIGEGPLEEKIKEKVKKIGLQGCVEFLGKRNDVNKYYQAMDIFLFPSLYEGLGMCLIEAQVSGLRCITSTEVPKVVKITKYIEFLNLKNKAGIWANECLKEMKELERKSQMEVISKNGYDIKKEAKKLENIYLEMMKGK